MSAPLHRIPRTVQELRLLPEDDKRWELVDGDLTVTPSPSTTHQRVSRMLLYSLMTQLELPGLAQVIAAPVDVVFDDLNVVVPDLVIVSRARTSIVTKRAVEGSPDVLVEILSPTSAKRDRHLKFELYARFGVREYWIADPDLGELDAYRLLGTKYQLRAHYDATSTLRCPDFLTLKVDLSSVFTED